jgi:hypothetical protein
MLVYDEFKVIYDKMETSWIKRFFVVHGYRDKLYNYVKPTLKLGPYFYVLALFKTFNYKLLAS